MNRAHIASNDISKVQTNIKNNKINVIAHINKYALESLTNNINNAGNAIIMAKSSLAPTYPTASYKDCKISGLTMCKLVAIQIAIEVINSFIVNGREIKITLHQADIDYCKKHNLNELSILGYVAIFGEVPKEDELTMFLKNEHYYESMGILLNSRERHKSSWMKSLYRSYRHAILECLMGDLNRRGILDIKDTTHLIKSLEIVRDSSSVYNLNQYIYHLCDVVGVVDVNEKNLYMTILSDKEGFKFVCDYKLTKYYKWRKSCQNQINKMKNMLNISEKPSKPKMVPYSYQRTSTLECFQRV